MRGFLGLKWPFLSLFGLSAAWFSPTAQINVFGTLLAGEAIHRYSAALLNLASNKLNCDHFSLLWVELGSD